MSKAKSMDWVKVLTAEARLSDVIVLEDIAAKYKLPAASVWKALSRLAGRRLVTRLANGVYLNKLVRDYSPADFISILRPDSYVSLEYALNHWGLSTQSPVALTCVTTGKPKEYGIPEFMITFRAISKALYWGFVEKQTRYSRYRIAEPEKALLDWIYLSLQAGLKPRLDEIAFTTVEKLKLIDYANKYPNTVRHALVHSLAFEHFAAWSETRSAPRSHSRNA